MACFINIGLLSTAKTDDTDFFIKDTTFAEVEDKIALRLIDAYNDHIITSTLDNLDILVIRDGVTTNESDFRILSTYELDIIKQAFLDGLNIWFVSNDAHSSQTVSQIMNAAGAPWSMEYNDLDENDDDLTVELRIPDYDEFPFLKTPREVVYQMGSSSVRSGYITYSSTTKPLFVHSTGKCLAAYQDQRILGRGYVLAYMAEGFVDPRSKVYTATNLVTELFDKNCDEPVDDIHLNVKSQQIYLYQFNGDNNTQGEMDVVIFYDRMPKGIVFTGGAARIPITASQWTYLTTTEYYNFNNETCSMLPVKLVTPRTHSAYLFSNVYVWIAAGRNSGGAVNVIERLTKSALTYNAVHRNALPKSLNGPAYHSTNWYGFVLGGWGSTTIYRLEFYNDTKNILTKANLLTTYFKYGSFGGYPQMRYAFIVGGFISGNISTRMIQRFDVSNQLVNAVHNANLLYPRGASECTGNENYAYIIGGAGQNAQSQYSIEKYNWHANTLSVKNDILTLKRTEGISEIDYDRNRISMCGGGSLAVNHTILVYDLNNEIQSAAYRSQIVQGREGMAGGKA